jgi:hypothetical protein
MTTAEALLTREDHQHFLSDIACPEKVVALLRRGDGRVVINADDIVALSPAMENAPDFEVGQQVYKKTKAAADSARQAAFEYLLSSPPEDPVAPVLFTVAGPGSGKSSVTNTVTHAEFILDAVHGEPGVLPGRIQMALDSGRTVHVVFVGREPGEAMEGNIERALYAKRMADGEGLARSHVSAAHCFLKAIYRFGRDERVLFQAYLNRTDEPLTEILPPTRIEPPDLDKTIRRVNAVIDEIAAQGSTRKCAGIPEAVIRAARGLS